MKKILAGLLAGFLLAATASSSVLAQTAQLITTSKTNLVSKFDELLDEKPIYINGSSPNAIASKAIRSFSREFKGATDIRWIMSDEGGYIAKFIFKGVACRSDYDFKGRCLVITRYYNEDKLPQDIRHQVKSNYYDYSIYRVAEYFLSNKTAYVVTLESEDSWIKVSVIDGTITELENYKKG